MFAYPINHAYDAQCEGFNDSYRASRAARERVNCNTCRKKLLRFRNFCWITLLIRSLIREQWNLIAKIWIS